MATKTLSGKGRNLRGIRKLKESQTVRQESLIGKLALFQRTSAFFVKTSEVFDSNYRAGDLGRLK